MPDCVDCRSEGIPTNRPTTGKRVKRCATHTRARSKATRDAARAARLERTYSLTAAEYEAIYEAQGGVCAICRRATGKSKALAVDHDHACCPGPTSCGRCIRALCCSVCNRMLGHLRDDPEMVERVLVYLNDPPGRRLIDDMLG